MIINFVLPAIGHSGGMAVVYKYAELLSEAGHDVVVYKEIIRPNLHRYHSKIINLVHRIYCTFKALINSFKINSPYDRYVFCLNNHSVRNGNVVIATAWPTAYEVNKLDKSKGKKYYFIQDFENWDNVEIAKKTYKLPLKKIVISTWINQMLKKHVNIGPFPIVFNGIDKKEFYYLGEEIERKQISFLMLNHRLPKKGVDNGIKAFESVRKANSNCVLRMFGMCDKHNLPSYVEYYQNPSKEELLKLYSISDIFLFPSLEEGWGLTPIEAMACRCAVVGTRTGYVLDIGENGENMMISEPGDVDGMIRNIQILLNDSALLEKVKANGEKTVTKLSWKESAHRLEMLLKN